MKEQANAHESADSQLTKEGFDSLHEMLEGLAGRSFLLLLLLLGFLRLRKFLLHLRQLLLQVFIRLPGLLCQPVGGLHSLRKVLAKLRILSLELHELGREVGDLPGGGKNRLQNKSNEEADENHYSTEPTLACSQTNIGSGATWEGSSTRNKSEAN